ncbi:TetR/AcrR family transcriptional regulator [Curtobacterium sp. VKM Ac-1376]|uniref:TetR/AcrR family transcriptional regulator n=1 Tax=Curtobacterium sp. VKM Ac-1376 TaxID=123312 RepID=UPI00188D9C92|nr:TetR/AcrR family transcriptional regulator [Curtobacterium sp. VKM Ac-1376]MBF4615792.1 TetR family transcriptional regulator [Curtobacterium sp. VKM Ac-1376]
MQHVSTTEVPAATDCGLRERKKQQTRHAIHRAALALVTDRGLAGVTIEAICADAGVSPRTFFNYFPSKGEAALGLPPTEVPDAARQAFLAASGPLVSDLCELVAQTVTLPEDRERTKALVQARPEMVPTMLQWMANTRLAVVTIAAERTDADAARTAVTLVMAAVIESAHRFADGSRAEVADRLRAVVAEMGRLATA